MPYSPDVPLGRLGAMFGLRVKEPEFESSEMVVDEWRTNQWQMRIRSVGGRLYLTDRRLIFVPTRIEARLAGRVWAARLSELEGARLVRLVRTVGVTTSGGRTERFVVYEREETAARIDRTIKAASSAPGPP
jgi:hypothetical protein